MAFSVLLGSGENGIGELEAIIRNSRGGVFTLAYGRLPTPFSSLEVTLRHGVSNRNHEIFPLKLQARIEAYADYGLAVDSSAFLPAFSFDYAPEGSTLVAAAEGRGNLLLHKKRGGRKQSDIFQLDYRPHVSQMLPQEGVAAYIAYFANGLGRLMNSLAKSDGEYAISLRMVTLPLRMVVEDVVNDFPGQK